MILFLHIQLAVQSLTMLHVWSKNFSISTLQMERFWKKTEILTNGSRWCWVLCVSRNAITTWCMKEYCRRRGLVSTTSLSGCQDVCTLRQTHHQHHHWPTTSSSTAKTDCWRPTPESRTAPTTRRPRRRRTWWRRWWAAAVIGRATAAAPRQVGREAADQDDAADTANTRALVQRQTRATDTARQPRTTTAARKHTHTQWVYFAFPISLPRQSYCNSTNTAVLHTVNQIYHSSDNSLLVSLHLSAAFDCVQFSIFLKSACYIVTATSIQLFYSFYHVGLRCVNLFIQTYDDDDDD